MRIRRYIQGYRSGREANRIERDAMRDPFLAEALEGYEQTKEDPVPHINILRRKIRSRNQRRLNVFKYGGIAASLLFIFGFGIYFKFQPDGIGKEPAIITKSIEEENISTSSSGIITDAIAQSINEEVPQDRRTLNRTAKEKIQSTEMAQLETSLPEPVIGFDAYNKYVEENMIRPTDDCKDIKGKVIVSFFIDASGKPYDIKIEESLCSSADQEAIRLIKDGPPWKSSETRIYDSINF